MIDSNKKWTAKKVAEHFAEAELTTEQMPSANTARYCNLYSNSSGISYQKIMSKSPYTRRAAAGAISRLEQTYEWLQWISVEERKLIHRRAANVLWEDICQEFKCSKSIAWRKWMIALNKISARLNARKITQGN